MAKALGMAGDFYRLRIIRIDDSDNLDLEWREDILYREPAVAEINEFDRFRVQAVDDTNDVATDLKGLDDQSAAHEWLTRAQDDLSEMTRAEFEARYFPQRD